MITLLTRQRELFATCSDTDAVDGISANTTVAAEERFGWTTFSAADWKRTSRTVDTAAGARTNVGTTKMSPSRVSPTRLKQLLWLEEEIHVGRLEVFHGARWGTVCDDGFTDAAARVVCYSLGFGHIGKKVNIDLYGVGDGLIWLNNVNCSGTEQYIGECSLGGWRDHNCSHRQDVAISCTENTTVTPVRLVGGSSSTGRLEVFHEGLWGTVCGEFFTAEAASVVCNMLRLGTGTKIRNSRYITSEGPIWLDDVRCNGTETDIAECSHNGWGVHNCQHRDDVAISCTPTKVEVRLNGGRDPREGRLEVFYDGTWRSVCRDGFNDAAARVVCNMLGFGETSTIMVVGRFGFSRFNATGRRTASPSA